jgi:hypothetical protein
MKVKANRRACREPAGGVDGRALPPAGSAPPLVEIIAVGEGLAELPAGAGDVVELEELAVGGGDPEGDALAGEVAVGLPVGAPVP